MWAAERYGEEVSVSSSVSRLRRSLDAHWHTSYGRNESEIKREGAGHVIMEELVPWVKPCKYYTRFLIIADSMNPSPIMSPLGGGYKIYIPLIIDNKMQK